jgi:hypothetical protein
MKYQPSEMNPETSNARTSMQALKTYFENAVFKPDEGPRN